MLFSIFSGYLCERRHLEKTDGCCQTAQSSILGPYICDTCSLKTHCCGSFEHCISCCLKPDHVGSIFIINSINFYSSSVFIFKIIFVQVI